MLSKEEQIDAWIEEIATTGSCEIDGVDVTKESALNDMYQDDDAFSVLMLLTDGFIEKAIKINTQLFDKCARSLIIDAIASIEDPRIVGVSDE